MTNYATAPLPNQMKLPSAFNVGSFRWGFGQNGGVPVGTVQAMALSADGWGLKLGRFSQSHVSLFTMPFLTIQAMTGTVSWWLCSTPRDERNVLWSDWFSLVNCLICCLELAFRICRSRWALPPCSTSTLARELPPLPLPSVWGRSASREDLTGLKCFFWKITLGVVQLFTLWSWLFQFCWLPVGVAQQGEALEGHQGEIWESGRGGLNTKCPIT